MRVAILSLALLALAAPLAASVRAQDTDASSGVAGVDGGDVVDTGDLPIDISVVPGALAQYPQPTADQLATLVQTLPPTTPDGRGSTVGALLTKTGLTLEQLSTFPVTFAELIAATSANPDIADPSNDGASTGADNQQAAGLNLLANNSTVYDNSTYTTDNTTSPLITTSAPNSAASFKGVASMAAVAAVAGLIVAMF